MLPSIRIAPFQSQRKFLPAARSPSSVMIAVWVDRSHSTGRIEQRERAARFRPFTPEGPTMSSLQPYMDWEANGPSYLTDIEVDEESPSAGEEVWHVAVSWDDIKM